MYRTFAILVTVLWLAAMSHLVIRDIVPAWTAQEPPRPVPTTQPNPVRREDQCGIFDSKNRRVGTVWSILTASSEQTRRQTTIELSHLPMLPPIRIDNILTFRQNGDVEDFDLDVFGFEDGDGKPIKINMKGENYGRYIPCVVEVGPFRRTFKLDAAASQQIGDCVRTFDTLPNLKVGQSWRVQILDPISAMLNQTARITSIVAKVESQETIEHNGRPVECFVVTAARSKAWVTPEGRVLVQEADMPGFGRIIVRDEPFDEILYTAFRGSLGPAGRLGPVTQPSQNKQNSTEPSPGKAK